MRTFSGKLIDTQSISTSKAANYLSKFVNSDNGASQSVSAYLLRASTAFNELAYVDKHHKKRRSKEAGSVNSDINPKKSEEIEARVLKSGYDNRKPDDYRVEGRLGKKRKSEEDNVTVNQQCEETINKSDYYLNIQKKKRRTKSDN